MIHNLTINLDCSGTFTHNFEHKQMPRHPRDHSRANLHDDWCKRQPDHFRRTRFEDMLCKWHFNASRATIKVANRRKLLKLV